LYERANGYECQETKAFVIEGKIETVNIVKCYPPDTTACMAWLNNRKPEDWRYKKEKPGSNEENNNTNDLLKKISESLPD
jgi:hypothetical protein